MGNGLSTEAINLTKAEKKDLKAQKKAEAARVEAQRKLDAEALALKLAGASEKTKTGDVRGEVKDALKDLYKEGEIDKETYKEARSYSGKGNLFGRIFGKKKDSTIAFEGKANENNVEQTKEKGPDFGKKLTKKLEKAGISNETIYEVADSSVGSDNKFNYSWKRRQPGEVDDAKAKLNSKENNPNQVEFSKRETKKIMRKAGYKVEHAVNGGKVVRDALIGGVVTSPLEFLKISQNSKVAVDGISAVLDQSLKISGSSVVGAVVGAGISIGVQTTRVEKKVAEKVLPDYVKTYDDYVDYNNPEKGYCTKKGAPLMDKIAKFYVGEDGQTLDKKSFESDLQKAAGEGSVLNYEEAVNLHSHLVNKKDEKEEVVQIKAPETTPKEKCEIKLTEDVKKVVQEDATKAYQPKKGEYWYSIAQAKYPQANANEIKAIVRILKEKHCPQGMKSTDAFQPKVMYLPEVITIGEKEFKLNADGKVKNTNSGPSSVKTTQAASNPFKNTVEQTLFGFEGCDTNANGLTKEQRDAQIEALKKANPEKEYIVK